MQHRTQRAAKGRVERTLRRGPRYPPGHPLAIRGVLNSQVQAWEAVVGDMSPALWGKKLTERRGPVN